MMRGMEALPKHASGASRLELIVVTLILVALSAWLLHTMRFYQELTEKTVIESTIINLRSGLRFKIADLILKGTPEKQAGLALSNPVLYAESPPRGYLGEMRAPGELPPGSWFYEQDKAELVYIPVLKANLALADGSRPERLRLRWQIKAAEVGRGGGAVDIEILTPYQWF
jgi:hypothetical protein